MSEYKILEIGTITLKLSSWAPWRDLLIDNRGGFGVYIPNQKPGIYEVKRADHSGDERLYIGQTGDLRLRVRQGLVKGKIGHPAGTKICSFEDTSKLSVRWAETSRPACAEEELLHEYRARFGILPLYNRNG
jgi:hypothetical protein